MEISVRLFGVMVCISDPAPEFGPLKPLVLSRVVYRVTRKDLTS